MEVSFRAAPCSPLSSYMCGVSFGAAFYRPGGLAELLELLFVDLVELLFFFCFQPGELVEVFDLFVFRPSDLVEV